MQWGKEQILNQQLEDMYNLWQGEATFCFFEMKNFTTANNNKNSMVKDSDPLWHFIVQLLFYSKSKNVLCHLLSFIEAIRVNFWIKQNWYLMFSEYVYQNPIYVDDGQRENNSESTLKYCNVQGVLISCCCVIHASTWRAGNSSDIIWQPAEKYLSRT